MTKLVTFNRAMAPFNAGDTRLVPDDLAARLEAAGDIAADPPDFPARPAAAPAVTPAMRPKLSRGRELLGQTYLTK